MVDTKLHGRGECHCYFPCFDMSQTGWVADLGGQGVEVGPGQGYHMYKSIHIYIYIYLYLYF